MKNSIALIIPCVMLYFFAQLHAEPKSHDAKVEWGYSGETGPDKWGDLSPDFILGKIGRNQSPINIAGDSVIEADLPHIKFDYKEEPLKILNVGHTIDVLYESGNSIEVDGIRFVLKQFHFHNPSENHIEGVEFPLEAHLVHADKDGNLAVIAVMFTEGKENTFLEKIWAHAPKKKGETTTAAGETVNVMEMLPANKDYYRFGGSLTTPPCSEGVRWLVLKNPVEVANSQVKAFGKLIGFANDRPIQPTNARAILK
jgi:carbonic anhydrase